MQELPKDEKPLNLFLIPSANDRCRNPAYPSFELTMRTLRNLILSYPRNNQPHNHEKSWFSNAAKGRFLSFWKKTHFLGHHEVKTIKGMGVGEKESNGF